MNSPHTLSMLAMEKCETDEQRIAALAAALDDLSVAYAQLERDIRTSRECILTLVADRLGVEHEPHQTFDERLLEASVRQLAEALACPRPRKMGEHACMNRKQCWEPCGDLGNHEEYAKPVDTSVNEKDD